MKWTIRSRPQLVDAAQRVDRRVAAGEIQILHDGTVA
jgi:hypothetical protein